MSSALLGAAMALAFALELCALAAFGWWGWHAGDGTATPALLGIGMPVTGAVLWGLLAAPRAPLATPVLAGATRVAFYAAAALALHATGHPRLAVSFLTLVLLDAAVVSLVPATGGSTARSGRTAAPSGRESVAGRLLAPRYGSAELDRGMLAWLDAVRAAAERPDHRRGLNAAGGEDGTREVG